MLGSLVDNRFDAFGPTRFLPNRAPRLHTLPLDADRKTLRRRLRASCASAPGIYGMLDAGGQLIYVGKSKALLSRLRTYLGSGQDDEAKHKRIIARTERLVWEVWPHEFPALLRELELIVRWRPRFNVQGQPGRARYAWLCLRRSSAPGVELSPQPLPGRFTIGPFTQLASLREAVRAVNDAFALRDCPQKTPMYFADQSHLFPIEHPAGCLRAELETCLAPCVGRCTQRQYAEQVQRVEAFLRGTDRSLLTELEATMHSAASSRSYEQAALARDRWAALSHLAERLNRLADVRRNYTFVYPLSGKRKREVWYLVRNGQVLGAVRAPTCPRTAAQAADGLAVLSREEIPRASQPDVSVLVSSWFGAHPEELDRTIDLPSAVARVHARAAAPGGH
jgi:excinuclease ABC subunit C